jgi:hypothetical protein
VKKTLFVLWCGLAAAAVFSQDLRISAAEYEYSVQSLGIMDLFTVHARKIKESEPLLYGDILGFFAGGTFTIPTNLGDMSFTLDNESSLALQGSIYLGHEFIEDALSVGIFALLRGFSFLQADKKQTPLVNTNTILAARVYLFDLFDIYAGVFFREYNNVITMGNERVFEFTPALEAKTADIKDFFLQCSYRDLEIYCTIDYERLTAEYAALNYPFILPGAAGTLVPFVRYYNYDTSFHLGAGLNNIRVTAPVVFDISTMWNIYGRDRSFAIDNIGITARLVLFAWNFEENESEKNDLDWSIYCSVFYSPYVNTQNPVGFKFGMLTSVLKEMGAIDIGIAYNYGDFIQLAPLKNTFVFYFRTLLDLSLNAMGTD